MSDELEMRRRRASYRAAHRGTKEMDIMLGTYAQANLPSLADPQLDHFEQFITLSDPKLQGWLLQHDTTPAPAFADLVAAVRKFHGL